MAARIARKSPIGFSWSFAPFKLIITIPAIAIIKPAKKLTRNFSSEPINMWARIAVKNGATEIITPTLDASV